MNIGQASNERSKMWLVRHESGTFAKFMQAQTCSSDGGVRLINVARLIKSPQLEGLYRFQANRKSCWVSATWLCTTTSLPELNVIVLSWVVGSKAEIPS